MDVQIPALIVLFGPTASALAGEIVGSLQEHVARQGMRSLLLWRIDAKQEDGLQESELLQRTLQWKTIDAENYIETLFMAEYQKLMDQRMDDAYMSGTCNLFVISCGCEAKAKNLAALRDRLSMVQQLHGRNLRTQWLWLTEDALEAAGDNQKMLIADGEKDSEPLDGFDRVIVLSANQANGGYSYITRRQRIDALVPCMLEAANASVWEGSKIQTLAYRKLNCTSAEIRRLKEHRCAEKLLDWLKTPVESEQMWKVISEDGFSLFPVVDEDVSDMARKLAYEVADWLPDIRAFLTIANLEDMKSPVILVEAFQANNEALLIETYAAKQWRIRWIGEVKERLRGQLALKSFLSFFAKTGHMQQKLFAVEQYARQQSEALHYRGAGVETAGLFGRKRTQTRNLQAAVNTYREALAYHIVSKRLREMLGAAEELQQFIQGLIAQTEDALQGNILAAEAEQLYTSLAVNYNQTLQDTINTLKPDDGRIFGDVSIFYPQQQDVLAMQWHTFANRVAECVEQKNGRVGANFTDAYMMDKTPQRLEQDIANELKMCNMQLAGCDIKANGRSAFYAGKALTELFQTNQLHGEPLRQIAGDLIEYLCFGDVANEIKALKAIAMFDPSRPFEINSEALNWLHDGEKKAEPLASELPVEISAEDKNPFNVKLDSRNGEYMLYWTWPAGHTDTAVIHITAGQKHNKKLMCTMDTYRKQTGLRISPEDLAVGINTITVCHEQQTSVVEVAGRRETVNYEVRVLPRKLTIPLEQERQILQQIEVQYTIPNAETAAKLRLVLDLQGGTVYGDLARYKSMEASGNVLRFFSAATQVTLEAKPQYEDLLMIRCSH